MATRVPTNNSSGQAGVRGGNNNRGPVGDGTVFSSMKEFWLWVAIVTLILALLCGTLVAVFHVEKQLRKTEAILLRAEQFDKKKNPKQKEPEDE